MVAWLTFVIIGAACLGGGLAAVAAFGGAIKLLRSERQSLLYRLSYIFMATSVAAFVVRSLVAAR